MDIGKIDVTKKYTFIEAWRKGTNDRNVIITSDSSGNNYKIDSSSKKLKFYNPVIAAWQVCTYILPEEIFNMWYITADLS